MRDGVGIRIHQRRLGLIDTISFRLTVIMLDRGHFELTSGVAYPVFILWHINASSGISLPHFPRRNYVNSRKLCRMLSFRLFYWRPMHF